MRLLLDDTNYYIDRMYGNSGYRIDIINRRRALHVVIKRGGVFVTELTVLRALALVRSACCRR